MTDRRAELEAAIDDDPDDVRAYEVYADCLQEQGDPRGELMALAIAADTNRGLTVAEREFLDANHTALLPPAWTANVAERWSSLGGSLWRWGCFRRARVGAGCEEVLAELLAHPAGRFVVELEIEHGIAMQRAADDLAAAPRHALRHLVIGAGNAAQIGSIDADLARVWRAVPRLEHLAVVGLGARLGELVVPSLRHLRVDAASISSDQLAALSRAQLSNLVQLELGVGPQLFTSLHDTLRAIDERELFPALRDLSLTRTHDTAELVETLARSPLVRRLERLSLRGGTLDDAGAALVVRHAAAFAHLELDLNLNRLTYAGISAFAELRNVDARFQQQQQPEYDDIEDEG